MAKQITTRIALADREHARTVELLPGRVFRTLQPIGAAAAHQRSSDLMADSLGRSFESIGTARHAVEPRRNPHALARGHVANRVAAALNAAAAGGQSYRPVLAAPVHAPRQIKSGLEAASSARRAATLQRDPVRVRVADLPSHFAHGNLPL